MQTYETDVVAWAEEQSGLLRSGRFDLLDIEHIAEEIEDVGKSEQRELANRMALLLGNRGRTTKFVSGIQPATGGSWQFPPSKSGRGSSDLKESCPNQIAHRCRLRGKSSPFRRAASSSLADFRQRITEAIASKFSPRWMLTQAISQKALESDIDLRLIHRDDFRVQGDEQRCQFSEPLVAVCHDAAFHWQRCLLISEPGRSSKGLNGKAWYPCFAQDGDRALMCRRSSR